MKSIGFIALAHGAGVEEVHARGIGHDLELPGHVRWSRRNTNLNGSALISIPVRRMGGANGSLECLSYDKLRDPRYPPIRAARRWLSQRLNPSYCPTGKSAKTCLVPFTKI